MAKQMIINPGKCTGCSTCSLTCSFFHNGEFNINKSYITITKHDFEGIFHITISSSCKGCKQCAEVCPSGALSALEIPDPAPGAPGH